MLLGSILMATLLKLLLKMLMILRYSSLLECNSVNCYIVVPLWYLRKYEDIVYRIWLKWEFTYDAHEFS